LLEYCITKYKNIIKAEDGSALNIDMFVNQLMETPEIIAPELIKAQKVYLRFLAPPTVLGT
tara:strand:+ start:1910 stop:2092 length:183 start_codon:yes stop_codon:yes gene_type:complete